MLRLSSLAIACALAACQLMLGAYAHAEVLELGATGEYVYNSNFFNAAGDPEAANSFQIGPTVGLYDRDGRFRYDIGYEGGYQLYVDQDGVDAWESRLRARASYEIDSLTSVRVTNRFRDISNLRFSRQDIELSNGALDPTQDRYFRNDLELELRRALTRLTELRVRAAHHWIDFEKNIDRNDSVAYEVGTELDHRIATRHTVGAGVSYVYQDFEGAFSRLGSRVDYINSYLSWVFDIEERIQLRVSGGPSWVYSDEETPSNVRQTLYVGGKVNGSTQRAAFASCTPAIASQCDFNSFPPIGAPDLGGRQSFALGPGQTAGSGSEVTFFGGASLTAGFVDWNVSATYSRRQATTSGDSLASSLDQVFLNVEYAPPRYRWSAFVAFSFDRRETLTEGTQVDFIVVNGAGGAAERSTAFTRVDSSESRRDNYVAIVGVRRGFARNSGASLEFRYRRSQVESRGFTRPDTDTFLVLVSFDYTLAPIELRMLGAER